MPGTADDLTSVAGHVVQFYDHDAELVGAVARYAGAGLDLGDGVLLLATEDHLVAFEAEMRAGGHDVSRLVAVEAGATLSRLLGPEGRVDASRFFDVVGGLVAATSDAVGGRRVRIFGEMVALLCAEGDVVGAMALEGLWNELASGTVDFTLLCAYPTAGLGEDERTARFYRACDHHDGVVRAGGSAVDAWRRFDRHPTAASGARRFVSLTLDRWGRGSLAPDARIVVSELATNAVLHARSSFHVSVSEIDDGVRIAVHDDSPQAPVARRYTPLSATGRGMRLVEALSTRWGTDPLPNRKAVWADLAGP